MITTEKKTITIDATVDAPVEKVWKIWTDTNHITKWNSASPDWHTPKATHDFKPGGRFSYRMEAKDGSSGFDFGGIFDAIEPHRYIEYTMDDGRKVRNHFQSLGDKTHITTEFEAENTNSFEMQKDGWQAILNNFKCYAECMREN